MFLAAVMAAHKATSLRSGNDTAVIGNRTWADLFSRCRSAVTPQFRHANSRLYRQASYSFAALFLKVR